MNKSEKKRIKLEQKGLQKHKKPLEAFIVASSDSSFSWLSPDGLWVL
jgi:hypothetical protein